MLDRQAMVALRTGATLAYALPSVHLRVGCPDRLVVVVHRPPLPAGGRAIAPCAFRRAVASAHERWTAGERLTFLGLPAGCRPVVDVGVSDGDLLLPGDLFRVTLGSDWLHLFATPMPVDRCREAADPARGIGFHRDVATDITLVHRACAARDLHVSDEVIDALVGVLGRCVASDLVDGLPVDR